VLALRLKVRCIRPSRLVCVGSTVKIQAAAEALMKNR
jgi:hypothetical protein